MFKSVLSADCDGGHAPRVGTLRWTGAQETEQRGVQLMAAFLTSCLVVDAQQCNRCWR